MLSPALKKKMGYGFCLVGWRRLLGLRSFGVAGPLLKVTAGQVLVVVC